MTKILIDGVEIETITMVTWPKTGPEPPPVDPPTPPEPEPEPDPPGWNPRKDKDLDYQGVVVGHQITRNVDLPPINIPAGRYRRGETSEQFSKALAYGVNVPEGGEVWVSFQRAQGGTVRVSLLDHEGMETGHESASTFVGDLRVRNLEAGRYYILVEQFLSLAKKTFETDTTIEGKLSTLEMTS